MVFGARMIRSSVPLCPSSSPTKQDRLRWKYGSDGPSHQYGSSSAALCGSLEHGPDGRQ